MLFIHKTNQKIIGISKSASFLTFAQIVIIGMIALNFLACQSSKSSQKKSKASDSELIQKKDQHKDQIAALKRRIAGDPKDINAYAQLGYLYGLSGDIKKEIYYYEKALAVYPQYKEVYYNLACAYTDLGQKDKAFHALELALKNGFQSRSLIESDADLRALREDARFQALLKKYFDSDSKETK